MLSLDSFTAWKRRLVEMRGFFLGLDQEVIGEAVAALRARVDQIRHLDDAVGLAARLPGVGRGPSAAPPAATPPPGRSQASEGESAQYA